MLKKKKTTASGEPVMVQSVRRTRSHRMKFLSLIHISLMKWS